MNARKIKLGEKYLLTLEEASCYTGIGISKLRMLCNEREAELVLRNGTKRLIRRGALEKYLDSVSSI